MTTAVAQPSASNWAPLRQPLFRAIWLAGFVSNIGTWMQAVGAVWLMSSLNPSPLLVALVTTAGALPMVFFSLPAGALADVVDRRRLLLVTEWWMVAAATILGVLTIVDAVTPTILLALTFLLSLGATLNAPAFSALTPELVPREQLPVAVTLGGVSFNLSRAVGPALGGAVVAAAGAGVAFLVNAGSFLGVIVVLSTWRRQREVSTMPAEHVLGAMRAGARYLRWAPPLRIVLVRTAAFVFTSAALFSLLPVYARGELHLGSGGYGALLAFVGGGAVCLAPLLPRLRQRLGPDPLTVAGTVLLALTSLGLAAKPSLALVEGIMVAVGVGWALMLSSLTIAAQSCVPAWVRGRALALFLLVFQLFTAAGSAVWGAVAQHWGTRTAYAASAGAIVAGLAAAVSHRLARAQDLDLDPSGRWGEPDVVLQPDLDAGPVLVTVEYRIDPERADEFEQAMRALSRIRRRDGVMRWDLYQDMAEPDRFVETVLLATWGEHLRQHGRLTGTDAAVEEAAWAFQRGGTPKTTHLIAGAHQHRPQHRHAIDPVQRLIR